MGDHQLPAQLHLGHAPDAQPERRQVVGCIERLDLSHHAAADGGELVSVLDLCFQPSECTRAPSWVPFVLARGAGGGTFLSPPPDTIARRWTPQPPNSAARSRS